MDDSQELSQLVPPSRPISARFTGDQDREAVVTFPAFSGMMQGSTRKVSAQHLLPSPSPHRFYTVDSLHHFGGAAGFGLLQLHDQGELSHTHTGEETRDYYG